MQLFVGTSGFSYKNWRGSFYPAGIRDDDMLGFYASQLNAVEINSTFYRFPTVAGLAGWAERVPDSFRFAIKVPQRITHINRLLNIGEQLHYLTETVATLGGRLGPLLFQLPPGAAADAVRLRDLASQLPPGIEAAFEFRHRSWFCDEVYRLLEREGHALCFNDSSDTGLHATTDWGYLRLRRDSYAEAEFAATAELVRSQPWRHAYVFIKHEAADSPLLARRWAQLAGAAAQL